MKISYRCSICNLEYVPKGFGRHILNVHHMSIKDYYDYYLKTNDEGKCKFCGQPTKFDSMTSGYRQYCSTACVSRGTKHKIEQTKLERYGDAHYVNKQKAKNTCLDRYGFENAAQSEQVKEKIKQTNIVRYGTECAAKADIVKLHYKENCRRKYGVDSTNALVEVKRKKETTYLSKYGVVNPNQNDAVIEKRKQTRQQRYGTYINNDILEKMKTTCLEKYGVEYALQHSDFQQKYKATCMAKYGVESYFQLSHEMALYKYNDILFDSSWELSYYIWLSDHNIPFVYHPKPITYLINNTIHYYFPDFLVDNEYIELKGPHLINNQKELINPSTKEVLREKTQCLIDNNVHIITNCKEYLTYVKTNYGNNFIKEHKIASHKFKKKPTL